ncbi:polysaccharide deacetylase family protein [Micromonosporaceae bacterium Da 78-11]
MAVKRSNTVRRARLVALLGAGLLLLAGCRDTGRPTAGATTAPPSSAPASAVPASPRTESAPRVIGVARPGARTVAGAHPGRAAAVSPAEVAALPQPTGAGATTRGVRPPVISHGPRDRKRIALTFDSNMTDAMLRRLASGQVRSYASPAVVDALQKSHTPATFFLAGKWVEAYPDLTRRITADPAFELASHSWSHEGFRPHCYHLGEIPRSAMAADVERSFEVLSAYSDHPSRYFRFPGGCFDQAALAAIAPAGCTVVEYDDVSGDAFGTSPKAIEAATVRQARPGSIVVLHITGDNARHTGVALPGIIRQLRAQGYDLVTLGDLLA